MTTLGSPVGWADVSGQGTASETVGNPLSAVMTQMTPTHNNTNSATHGCSHWDHAASRNLLLSLLLSPSKPSCGHGLLGTWSAWLCQPESSPKSG